MHDKYGKVGIGVITVGKRKLEDYKIPSWADFIIYVDKGKKGPAYARNRILESFQGYDHIFIWDDDAYPYLEEFYAYMLDQALEHNVHYMAIPEWFRGKIIGVVGEMVEWNESLAALTYQSKHALDKIGGYHTGFHTWGYEDILRNYIAVWKAGLSTREGAHCFPLRAMSYIYYSDAYENTPVLHLTEEEKEKFRALHKAEFERCIASDQIYYEFRKGGQDG